MAISKNDVMAIVEDLEDKRDKVKGTNLDMIPTAEMADAIYSYSIDLLRGLIIFDEISSE